MANSQQIEKVIDGQRNCVFKITGRLDTSDQAYGLVVDITTLSTLSTQGTTAPKSVRVKKIEYSISDGLEVQLYWDSGGVQASSAVMMNLYGRGTFPNTPYGELYNNATSPSGSIGLATTGWSAGAVLFYTVILEMYKSETLPHG